MKNALGLLLGVAVLMVPSSAVAADVTVRVEGAAQTLVPRTVITLPSAAPKPNGIDSCTANSVGGALWTATAGNWGGTYYASFGDYLLESLMGESYTYPDPRSWQIWINGRTTSTGPCGTALQQGDSLLMLISRCDGYDANYSCTSPPVRPLALSAPATARPGVPFGVSVQELAESGAVAPAAGAEVNGGAALAVTGATGSAMVTIAARGPATLNVGRAGSVRDSAALCVTDGADGYCGTTAPDGTTRPNQQIVGRAGGQTAAVCRTNGRDGFCGTRDSTQPWSHLSSPANGMRYKSKRATRKLSGKIEADGSGIAKVELRLTKKARKGSKNCGVYRDDLERFVKAKRCGAKHGRWFSIGDRADWSYLLPERPGSGRYVLDVRVTDKAGNRTKLARGYTRSVFYVG